MTTNGAIIKSQIQLRAIFKVKLIPILIFFLLELSSELTTNKLGIFSCYFFLFWHQLIGIIENSERQNILSR